MNLTLVKRKAGGLKAQGHKKQSSAAPATVIDERLANTTVSLDMGRCEAPLKSARSFN